MDKNYSMFKIKLKTGFFKKESYLLILGEQEMILKEEIKNMSEEFRIKKSFLQSVTISGENPLNIEIITEKDIFSGEFINEKELVEAAVQLNLFCGEILYFH
jgi:hypothetical protein